MVLCLCFSNFFFFFFCSMEYQVIPVKRFDEVIEHLRQNFFADEPLNKAVNLCKRGEGHKYLEEHSLKTLEANLSVMAVSDANEIAGVVLNGILRPGDLQAAKKKLQTKDDEKYRKIFQLLYDHNLQTDIFEYFKIDKAFDMSILSVDEKFRGKGIAKHLVENSESLAKKHGFKLLKADATGVFSQKIFKSAGFEVLHEQYYNKYVDNDNEIILPVESPHIKLQLLYKRLD
uniref:aralkylamine N-acetyltransferase n=1 Tax=Glossina pallidipes TaxID=7398 RepID=A0A1B0A181_GLOPL